MTDSNENLIPKLSKLESNNNIKSILSKLEEDTNDLENSVHSINSLNVDGSSKVLEKYDLQNKGLVKRIELLESNENTQKLHDLDKKVTNTAKQINAVVDLINNQNIFQDKNIKLELIDDADIDKDNGEEEEDDGDDDENLKRNYLSKSFAFEFLLLVVIVFMEVIQFIKLSK